VIFSREYIRRNMLAGKIQSNTPRAKGSHKDLSWIFHINLKT